MRAAFLAVDNHKQVACWCLPPFSRSSITTTSATVCQLAGTYRNDLPFPQRQRADQILAEVAEGKIDILIGTHKLCKVTSSLKI